MISDPMVERAVQVIAEAIHPQKIILFGSRAMGTARPDSDLDLVIIYGGEKSKRQVKLDIHRLLEPVSFPLDLFVLARKKCLVSGMSPIRSPARSLSEGSLFMDEETLLVVRRWVERAEHDLITAKVVLENKPDVTEKIV